MSDLAYLKLIGLSKRVTIPKAVEVIHYTDISLSLSIYIYIMKPAAMKASLSFSTWQQRKRRGGDEADLVEGSRI
jgi:hypothetical protein